MSKNTYAVSMPTPVSATRNPLFFGALGIVAALTSLAASVLSPFADKHESNYRYQDAV